MTFVKLIRWKNLLIVALTQFLLQYLVVAPFHFKYEQLPILDGFHFSLLVLTTVLIAAAGYVVNDICDQEIDAINKPDEKIVGTQISEKAAFQFYYFLIGIGGLLAIYLAWHVERFDWFFIYPIANIMLWAYAKYFKKELVIGNLIVSVFSAGVAGIVLFPEIFRIDLEDWDYNLLFMISLFSGYLFFAFTSSMMREVVKDLEDMEGDKHFGAKTLPIVAGVQKTKIFAAIWGMLLMFIFLILIGILVYQNRVVSALIGLVLVLLPLSYSIFQLYLAKAKKDYHAISQLLKFVMLGGLIFIILLVQ